MNLDDDENANRSEVLAHVLALSRDPFRRELARWLGKKTSDAALQAFADKSPDRWAQGVAILARNAGYTERVEVETSEWVKISQMSDAELNGYLEELRLKLAELEREPSPVPGSQGSHALPSPLSDGKACAGPRPNRYRRRPALG